MKRCRSSWHLASWRLLCALAMAACRGEEAVEEAVPGYSEGAYPTVPGAGASTELRFTEVAAEAGIDFFHQNGAFGRPHDADESLLREPLAASNALALRYVAPISQQQYHP